MRGREDVRSEPGPTQVVTVLLFPDLRSGVSREDRKAQALGSSSEHTDPRTHTSRANASVLRGSDPCWKVVCIKHESFPDLLSGETGGCITAAISSF